MKKVTKAVIPAAGLGTRVLPATKAMPKGMLPLVDKPAIQYLVENGCPSVPLLPPVLHCPFRRKKVKGSLRPFFICCTR